MSTSMADETRNNGSECQKATKDDEVLNAALSELMITKSVSDNRNNIKDDAATLVPEDEELTALHRQDCPICMLPLPLDVGLSIYLSCCGKLICRGCIVRHRCAATALGPFATTLGLDFLVDQPCEFCRSLPPKNDQEYLEWVQRRVESNESLATVKMGSYYMDGLYGLTRNPKKAMELYEIAEQLGSPEASYKISLEYDPQWTSNQLVKADKEKQRMYLEKAARGGHVRARYDLSRWHYEAGDPLVALHHAMIAACAGLDEALDIVKQAYMTGHASKNDFAKALRAHQAANDERKSEDREYAKKFDGFLS